MGGRDSMRGYLVQTMILVLDTLQSDDLWNEVSLEPNHESEKVDIRWVFPSHTRVVQVKSSINVFEKSEVEKWSMELKNSTLADDYELILVGNPSQSVVELSKTGFHGVKISSRSLDLDGMTKQIAHGLDVYCDQQDIPPRKPSSREILAKALITEFEKYSTEGKSIARDEFEQLLSKWIFLFLPQVGISHDVSSVPLAIPNYQLEYWFQPLLLSRGGTSSTLQSLLLRDDVNKIAVVGKSGGGKTSAMKMAAFDINLNTPYTAFWIPLLSYTVDLFTTIKRFLGWFELPPEMVVRTLQKHHIILFLDGLNEVPKDFRGSCAAEITQLISAYQGKLCISLLASDQEFYGFEIETYEISPLDEAAINQAVSIYFRDDNGKRQFLIDLIMRSTHEEKGLLAFLRTPIHLGFFLELAESKDFEAKTFRDLFGDVIEKRLARGAQHGKQGQIHVNKKNDLLMGLAFRSLVEDRGMKMSKAFVRDTFSIQSQVDVDLALDELIKGDILIDMGDSDVAWFHQSFRDYFAGRYLVSLVEAEKSFGKFPFGENRTVSAIAHAVRLSTRSSDLIRRSKLYLSFLESNPTFDSIRTVSMEYGWSKEYGWSNLMGDSKTLEEAENEYKQYKWGYRFLHAYQLILKAISRESSSVAEEIPLPRGLTVFFSPQVDFCLMLFSENSEIRFERLETLENAIYQIIREGKPCSGFCLYAPFLYLLDPEILAFIEIVVWIKLLKPDFDRTSLDNGYPELPITPNDWIGWGKITEPPVLSYQASKLSKSILLNWNEFYNPVTFQIDPSNAKYKRMRPRSYTISLGLLLPFTSQNWHKIDLPNKIYIPFPVHLLNGYYSVDSISGEMSTGKPARPFTQYTHLLKI